MSETDLGHVAALGPPLRGPQLPPAATAPLTPPGRLAAHPGAAPLGVLEVEAFLGPQRPTGDKNTAITSQQLPQLAH
jgi:hypothetical protein